ncbi:MAG TPA: hypothetical protein VN953_04985, partial [Gemmatimonadales bacterium]|nr:hypothetical protein [Gemmatimonadales bacterium]
MWKPVKPGVQGRVVRFRVPGGAEPAPAPDEVHAAAAGAADRPMPLAASILWKPIDAAAEQGAGLLPVFIAQRALAAVHDHCAATRGACFGLLTGDVVNCSETGASYVIVESTMRLPGSPEDDAKAVLVQGWVVAQDALRKSGDLLVGWYRGGGGEAGLSPAEADAHRAFFVQPWQVAVVVGSGDPTVGGVFRRSAGPAWAQECLPFYELMDPSSSRPDGSKPTRLRWDNYRTEETALVTSAALPVPGVSVVPVPAPPPPAPSVAPAWRTSPQQPQVLWPEQFGGAEGATAGGAWASGIRLRRARLWAAYATAGVLAVAGLFRLYSALASPTSPGPSQGPPEAVAVTPQTRLDLAADTLALAIAAFDLRAQLFASRQMQCPELARGLVSVEQRWTAYNS